MQQEVECCAEVITQEQGDRHFCCLTLTILNRELQGFVLGM